MSAEVTKAVAVEAELFWVLITDEENAKNLVSTAYPSLQVTAGGQQAAYYLSYGGFMGGWAALSVGQWSQHNKNIR